MSELFDEPPPVIEQHQQSATTHSQHSSTVSPHCSSSLSSAATLGRRHHPHSTASHVRHRTAESQCGPVEQPQPNQWFSSPELCHCGDADEYDDDERDNEDDDGDDDGNDEAEDAGSGESVRQQESPTRDDDMPERQTMGENNNGQKQSTRLGPIDEMTDSQLTTTTASKIDRAKMMAAAAMLESSSTMVSSLERSLEMAVQHSDGLSDREAKLKEAKTTFKLTHRRTSSNPTNLPNVHCAQKSLPASALSTTSSCSGKQKREEEEEDEDNDDEEEDESSSDSEENNRTGREREEEEA